MVEPQSCEACRCITITIYRLAGALGLSRTMSLGRSKVFTTTTTSNGIIHDTHHVDYTPLLDHGTISATIYFGVAEVTVEQVKSVAIPSEAQTVTADIESGSHGVKSSTNRLSCKDCHCNCTIRNIQRLAELICLIPAAYGATLKVQEPFIGQHCSTGTALLFKVYIRSWIIHCISWTMVHAVRGPKHLRHFTAIPSVCFGALFTTGIILQCRLKPAH